MPLNKPSKPAPFAVDALNGRQQAILPIAAFGAVGDMSGLDTALNRGLDAGLTISDIREVLTQLYAYAGFPRSLNALTALMNVVDGRAKRHIHDAPGNEPSHRIPHGDALRAAGAANQTKLVGRAVSGAVFDFAPAIGEYLQSHLFGDIFERDNLDWQSRELATIAMLSALPGAEAQLQSHLGICLNIGLTEGQLCEAARVLGAQVAADNERRASEALVRLLDSKR